MSGVNHNHNYTAMERKRDIESSARRQILTALLGEWKFFGAKFFFLSFASQLDAIMAKYLATKFQFSEKV